MKLVGCFSENRLLLLCELNCFIGRCVLVLWGWLEPPEGNYTCPLQALLSHAEQCVAFGETTLCYFVMKFLLEAAVASGKGVCRLP